MSVAVLAAFGGVIRNGFVSYDDELYVTRNAKVAAGLTADGIVWALTAREAANWHPVTWLSHMTDVEVFGLDPAGHHATSLFLHLGNVILLFWLLRSMTGELWKSAAVAALFALHPLRVESVAWIAERKDVLGTFFGLLALVAYVQYARGRRGAYAGSLAFFALSLASKPMLVTLPFLLLLLDYWPLERMGGVRAPREGRLPVRRLLFEKVPFLFLAGASSAVTIWAQTAGGATSALPLPLLSRLTNALVSYVSYLEKILLPVDLAVLYPHPRSVELGKVVAAAAFLLLVSVLLLRQASRRPYLAVGWLWYLGALVPVMGVVQVGWQAKADRYTYFPAIGLALLGVWGLAELTRGRPSWQSALTAVSVMALLILAALTRAQVEHWKDSVSLYTHTLQVTRSNDTIHMNLANALLRQGDSVAAIYHFRQAVSIDPAAADARYALAAALTTVGSQSEAIDQFEAALTLKPDFAQAHNRFGALLASRADWSKAAGHFQRAIESRAGYAEAHYGLAVTWAARGRNTEAIEHFETALRLRPEYPEAHNDLAQLLLCEGRFSEALFHFRRTIQNGDGLPETRYGLCLAQLATCQKAEAVQVLEESLRLYPASPELMSLQSAVLRGRAGGLTARDAALQVRRNCYAAENDHSVRPQSSDPPGRLQVRHSFSPSFPGRRAGKSEDRGETQRPARTIHEHPVECAGD